MTGPQAVLEISVWDKDPGRDEFMGRYETNEIGFVKGNKGIVFRTVFKPQLIC